MMTTSGERFKRVLNFEKPDRVPNMENGPMGPRVERGGHAQGMPADKTIDGFFGIESCNFRANWINDGHYDPLPGVVNQGWFDEADGSYSVRDCWGRVTRWRREGRAAEDNAHRILCDALKPRSEWDAIKGHFDPEDTRREFGSSHDIKRRMIVVPNVVGGPYPFEGIRVTPADIRAAKAAGKTLQFNAPSMLGSLREVMGFENLCMKLYTEPDMGGEILDARTAIGLRQLERAFYVERFDILHFWENIA
jgi:hypothetical protein